MTPSGVPGDTSEKRLMVTPIISVFTTSTRW